VKRGSWVQLLVFCLVALLSALFGCGLASIGIWAVPRGIAGSGGMMGGYGGYSASSPLIWLGLIVLFGLVILVVVGVVLAIWRTGHLGARSGYGWGIAIGGGLLAGLLLIVIGAGLVAALGPAAVLGRGPADGGALLSSGYGSNGERIYFTATSNSGQPIRADVGRGMMGGMRSCATCHGADGRGGRVGMMMSSFEAPDIRFQVLSTQEDPPFTDETIKRAITEGVDTRGEPLKAPMPRWSMSASDLDDLVGYLKSLP
jgi:cytochrome c oxidase subunit 2